MLRYLLTRSLRETAFPQNEHQTTAPAYARRFSARNWIIPSAYASAYALALLQFAYASSRNSGFGLREASYDTTLSTHVKGGLGRCSPGFLRHSESPSASEASRVRTDSLLDMAWKKPTNRWILTLGVVIISDHKWMVEPTSFG